MQDLLAIGQLNHSGSNKFEGHIVKTEKESNMTPEEARNEVVKIPLGARIQLVKKDGSIMDAVLKSHIVESIEEKNYDSLKVPALPPAVIVHAGMRFGNFRVEVEDLVKISHVG